MATVRSVGSLQVSHLNVVTTRGLAINVMRIQNLLLLSRGSGKCQFTMSLVEITYYQLIGTVQPVSKLAIVHNFNCIKLKGFQVQVHFFHLFMLRMVVMQLHYHGRKAIQTYLASHLTLCEDRLRLLQKRFKFDPKLFHEYDKMIKQQL